MTASSLVILLSREVHTLSNKQLAKYLDQLPCTPQHSYCASPPLYRHTINPPFPPKTHQVNVLPPSPNCALRKTPLTTSDSVGALFEYLRQWNTPLWSWIFHFILKQKQTHWTMVLAKVPNYVTMQILLSSADLASHWPWLMNWKGWWRGEEALPSGLLKDCTHALISLWTLVIFPFLKIIAPFYCGEHYKHNDTWRNSTLSLAMMINCWKSNTCCFTHIPASRAQQRGYAATPELVSERKKQAINGQIFPHPS